MTTLTSSSRKSSPTVGGTRGLKIVVINEEQPSNTKSPILVIVSGKVMDRRERQSLNARSIISVKPVKKASSLAEDMDDPANTLSPPPALVKAVVTSKEVTDAASA